MSEAVQTAAAAIVLDRCEQLAVHSSMPGGVLERVYLSPEHAAVNVLAGQWMVEAGMSTHQDAAGNQCGRIEGATHGLPALLLGSHLDTVPAAGKYDGILGVLCAIAVVGRIRASVRALPFALEVVAFGDEEGTRFGTALLGSRALAGTWLQPWWDLRDPDGVSLREAFAAFGLDPDAVGQAARSSDDFIGYLEAHIEQGQRLEDEDMAVGVVTSIAGARRFLVTITGTAGHAGTPWGQRRDALTGASEAIVAIERISRAGGLIATVGHLRVFPNAVNVIPGRVEFSLDLRSTNDIERDAGWAEIASTITDIFETRGLRMEWAQTHAAPAAHCSPRLRGIIGDSIRSTGVPAPLDLISAAGHDAMAISQLTEIGMLFIRCEGGVSHHPDEAVTAADVATAIDVLEHAVLALADRHASLGARR